MKAKRTDKSQAGIVAEIRKCGTQVFVTNWGDNFPDLIGYSDINESWVFCELKEINGVLKRGQLLFIAAAKGYIGVAIDFLTAYQLICRPKVNAFKQRDKDKISQWLIKNPSVKTNSC